MEPDRPSLTAIGTAFMRAFHAAHVHPKIFDDFLARHLLTEEECRTSEDRHLRAFELFDPDGAASCQDRHRALISWMETGAAPPILLARARYNEDLLEESIRRRQVRQYVILGAGLDTFAWRRPDLLEHLTVFEIDHPATQAHKRQRLQAAGREPPDRHHFLPLDFNREDLAAALKGSAYDTRAPSFFSWLGVTYYLTREAALATWGAVAASAPAGSSVFFDYLDTDAFVPEKAASRVQFMMKIVQRVGEPMLTGFDPATLAADLAAAGLRLAEDLGPEEIQQRFFASRPDGYYASEHAHFARAVVA